MKICGPKSSVCCMIISVWGVVQLTVMGIFFHLRSVNLAEDLLASGHDKHFNTLEEFYKQADRDYAQNAFNCWIAAGLYLITFFVSGVMFYMNKNRLPMGRYNED